MVGLRAASIMATAGLVALAGAAASCGEDRSLERASSTSAPRDPGVVEPALRRDVAAGNVVIDEVRRRVIVAMGDGGVVGALSLDPPHAVVAELSLGGDLTSVAMAADHRVIAVADREGGEVHLLDADQLAIIASVAVGRRPRRVVFDPAQPRFAYVTLEEAAEIARIDRLAGAVDLRAPTARLPSALAASGARDELYVLGRTDRAMRVIDRATLSEIGAIELAVEGPKPDATMSQGVPFAFEGLAFAGADRLWVPHQLYSGDHALEFRSTVFAAVSVVDVAARAEVATDAASGLFAGRKQLFEAIDVPDERGQSTIVSQPCAAALHPALGRAYVVACASEEVVVFDAATGRATETIRDLGVSHPSGIAVTADGLTAFVVGDRSRSVVPLDLGDGGPLSRVRVAGPPVALSGAGAPQTPLMQGRALFERARSSPGAPVLSGRAWLACNSCHLDGFGESNRFLIDAASLDRTVFALHGHTGLRDLFSTAAGPDDPTFDPHDVLRAVIDQGGLALDPTGEDRAGEVSPAAPTPEATELARSLARVVARDLPRGPSWLQPDEGPPPSRDLDGAYCGSCHQAEHDAWSRSAHAHAGRDPFVQFAAQHDASRHGPGVLRFCQGCHDPVGARLGDVPSATAQSPGVTCRGCHDASHRVDGGGNADLRFASPPWHDDHRGQGRLDLLASPRLCGGCHEQFLPGLGLRTIGTVVEHAASEHAARGETCVSCHMPRGPDGKADHAALGGNVLLDAIAGGGASREGLLGQLGRAVTLSASFDRARPGVVLVDVTSSGVGHAVPTGVADLRELWVEVHVERPGAAPVRLFGPDGDGALGPDAARFALDVLDDEGHVIERHEMSRAVRIAYDRRLMPGETAQISLDAASALGAPLDDATCSVSLRYRNMRPALFAAATGMPPGASPDVEIARAPVEVGSR